MIIERWIAGVLVGELHWDERPGAIIEVHLDVMDGYRRQGIGRSMMQEIEVMARREKIKSLTTFTAGDNLLAQKFFQAMGFVAVMAWGLYGHGRDGCFMWKTIGAPE